jgi:CheY-like chemotaxis protein
MPFLTTTQVPSRRTQFHPARALGAAWRRLAQSAAADIASGASQRKLRILLVDDNEDAVRSLEKLLNVLGHEARAATSGRAALAEGGSFMPDIVLLDLGMPEMDGFETAAAIRMEAWGAHVRIIALTGWGQQEDIRRTREAGFAAHLVKPLKTYDLLQLLQAPM